MSWMQNVRRFLLGHTFLTGIRQALGVLLPAIVVISTTQQYAAGLLASIGATTAAVIDQAGTPPRSSRPIILAAIALGAMSALIAGLLSTQTTLLWFAIPLLSFAVSMLTAYGPQGGMLAFVSLLLLTLSMRTPMPADIVLEHTLYSAAGGLFYLLYSQLFHYLLREREEREALATAIFASADFLRARARLYDQHEALEASYNQVLQAQSDVVTAHQMVREFILAPVPAHDTALARVRTQSILLFRELVELIDLFGEVRTDFAELHRLLPDADILLFARDALNKQADYLDLLASNVARNHPTVRRNSVIAELRAMDFELAQYREQGLAEQHPHLMLMLERITERLKASQQRLITLAPHTQAGQADPTLLTTAPTLERFLDHKSWTWSLYRDNLRWTSPAFRHSVRISVAALAAMALGTLLEPVFDTLHLSTLGSHGYWILLTVFVVMKPGYVLTRERNSKRLAGTLIGCALAVALFHWVHHPAAYLALLMLFGIMGYALITVNYLFAAMFITLLVLTAFHLLGPGGDAMVVARLVDTLLGCALAVLCSRILPNWEGSTAPGLVRALGQANLALFDAGLQTLEAPAAASTSVFSPASTTNSATNSNNTNAALEWRLALRNMYVAFSNYSGSVYRMTREPSSHQVHLPEFNRLMLENHTLALQIKHLVEQLQNRPPDEATRHRIGELRAELASTVATTAATPSLPQLAADNSVAPITALSDTVDESLSAIQHTIAAIGENLQRLQT